ncbi:hypothetical protein P5673_013681 [Acropora cervicornis]|uniref:Uncharacterized protein n=1 Tax=Acropora cervicornis TaxID=6130 RepID=A0AAD9QL56_ACRCE|nr:hypothetical protein P5673_013681 [Acropora cervicornis]
MEQMVKCA